jgi:hypothetical protein
MESYYELKKMLCRELDEIVAKSKGELSAGSLDAIDKLTHSIKSLVTIMAMDDSGYSYNDGYSGARRRDSMGRYADSGVSGRYYDDGYSGRGYPEGMRYSRDEGKSHMIHQFENLMNNASSQEERDVIQSALNRLRNM